MSSYKLYKDSITWFQTIIIFKPEVTRAQIREYEHLLGSTSDKYKAWAKDEKEKKLAYPVHAKDGKDYTSGRYYIFVYNSTSAWVDKDFDLMLRRDDNVLKYMTLAVDSKEEADALVAEKGFHDISAPIVINDEQEDPAASKPKSRSKTRNVNKSVDALDVLFGLAKYK